MGGRTNLSCCLPIFRSQNSSQRTELLHSKSFIMSGKAASWESGTHINSSFWCSVWYTEPQREHCVVFSNFVTFPTYGSHTAQADRLSAPCPAHSPPCSSLLGRGAPVPGHASVTDAAASRCFLGHFSRTRLSQRFRCCCRASCHTLSCGLAGILSYLAICWYVISSAFSKFILCLWHWRIHLIFGVSDLGETFPSAMSHTDIWWLIVCK